jgi:DNA-binding response OmpR family regulator
MAFHLNIAQNESAHKQDATARPRRALVIADSSLAKLPQQLASAGYEVRTAANTSASQMISEFKPDVVVMELHQGSENESLTLARRLRSESATYALPLVFVWTEDQQSVRHAALSIGADDYFALSLPFPDMLIRLDSLFWRIAAGRRAATAVGDQRLEIDNFMLMLDSMREDVEAGASGTIALIYAVARDTSKTLNKATRDRTLADTHGFLKLYLRRLDAVAFYGPTTLLVYLPRVGAAAAVEALSKLRREFLDERALENDIAIGLASFPENESDVESLIEKADAAAGVAINNSAARVIAHGAEEKAAARKISEPVSAQPTSEALEQHVLETRASVKPTPSPATAVAPSLNQLAEEQLRAVKASIASKEKAPAKNIEAVKTLNKEPENRKKSKIEKKPEVEKRLEAATAPPAQRKNFVPQVVRESKVSDDLEAVAASPVRAGGSKSNGADAARVASEAAARERERRASGAVMPRRLLLTVSDPARMAQLNTLIRSAGYEARAAFDGQQALDLLRIERPDLLLIDYELHGIDGIETLRRLRKQSGGRLTIPVVLLLPTDRETVGQEALNLGARRLVNTPYDPTDLLASVRLAGSAE